MNTDMDMDRRNLIAQWAFDTRSVLGRFHLWLEDVEEQWISGSGSDGEELSFVGSSLHRALMATAGVTALGTFLYGRYGEGKGLDKAGINRVKKDADAVSAYALSESIWYLTRSLPEKHAVMVCLGEGLMPKAGESPEMGSNPMLGFGRVYARPQVARFLDRRVNRLLNEKGYEWPEFWRDLQEEGITVWGAAVDTLENTSRFAKGAPTGPLTVVHLFDQPLLVTRPYEGYIGNLILPQEVMERAAEDSVLINFQTPREKVMKVISETYPGLKPENVHVWTLQGKSREKRLGKLWQEWRSLGVHLVDDQWEVPGTGMTAFTESGTYAPVFRVGAFSGSDGEQHLLLCDGYAASAEAIQGASLDPVLGIETSLSLFSSKFEIAHDRERHIMGLDPESKSFADDLGDLLESSPDAKKVEVYRGIIRNAAEAGMPLGRRTVGISDFMPNKDWQVLALGGYMLDDPYSGASGVEDLGSGVYRVTTRAATKTGILEAKLSLRMMEEDLVERRMVFLPLLDRFCAGQDYRVRPVKISDSGRIRNELKTLCSEGLEYLEGDRIRVNLDRVDEAVICSEKRSKIREILEWYRDNHPYWFRWLELAQERPAWPPPPGSGPGGFGSMAYYKKKKKAKK